MKKIVNICIHFVLVFIVFIIGIFIGSRVLSKDNCVGVYQTDYWNGGIGTLVLYKDGSCQYPSGGNATWKSDADTIYITIKDKDLEQEGKIKRIIVQIDPNWTDEKISMVQNSFEQLSNISGVFCNEDLVTYTLELREAEDDSKTQNEILKIDGVSIVDCIPYKPVEPVEHEAVRMKNGIMLHGHFFQKISD